MRKKTNYLEIHFIHTLFSSNIHIKFQIPSLKIASVGKMWGVRRNKKCCKLLSYSTLFSLRPASLVLEVPRAGVEPARVAPLVFETSASTDSAIWAWVRC